MDIAKSRVKWIDYAKAVAIYCVVLLHVGIPDPYKGLIRVFLIPLFFFLSGIFSKPERYEGFQDFFLKKGIRIIIPYFFFNSITYLSWFFIGRHFGLDSTLEISPLKPLLGVLLGKYELMQHYVPLWFLACLFSVESLFYLFFKYIKKNRARLFMILFFILSGYLNYKFNPYSLPWGLDIALSMIVFYAAGYMLKDRLLNDSSHILKYIIYSILSFSLVYLMYKTNSEVKVFSNFFGNYFYFYIGAFSGIFFTISVFKLLDYSEKSFNFLLFIGKNTLTILCLHLIASAFLKGILLYLLKINFYAFEHSLSYIILFSIATVLLLIPVIMLLSKYLPFALGKGKLYEIFKK